MPGHHPGRKERDHVEPLAGPIRRSASPIAEGHDLVLAPDRSVATALQKRRVPRRGRAARAVRARRPAVPIRPPGPRSAGPERGIDEPRPRHARDVEVPAERTVESHGSSRPRRSTIRRSGRTGRRAVQVRPAETRERAEPARTRARSRPRGRRRPACGRRRSLRTDPVQRVRSRGATDRYAERATERQRPDWRAWRAFGRARARGGSRRRQRGSRRARRFAALTPHTPRPVVRLRAARSERVSGATPLRRRSARSAASSVSRASPRLRPPRPLARRARVGGDREQLSHGREAPVARTSSVGGARTSQSIQVPRPGDPMRLHQTQRPTEPQRSSGRSASRPTVSRTRGRTRRPRRSDEREGDEVQCVSGQRSIVGVVSHRNGRARCDMRHIGLALLRSSPQASAVDRPEPDEIDGGGDEARRTPRA